MRHKPYPNVQQLFSNNSALAADDLYLRGSKP